MACSVRADRYHGFANDFIGLVLDRAISIYTNEFIFCVQCQRSRSATKFDTKINRHVLSRFANVPKKGETSTRLTNAVHIHAPTVGSLDKASPTGTETTPTQASRALIMEQTCRGPFSAVSTLPIERAGLFSAFLQIYNNCTLLHCSRLNFVFRN